MPQCGLFPKSVSTGWRKSSIRQGRRSSGSTAWREDRRSGVRRGHGGPAGAAGEKLDEVVGVFSAGGELLTQEDLTEFGRKSWSR
jgi:hypothetical protein